MRILGISSFRRDSAAALIEKGEIIAAVQEERFTRKKHDAAFPRRAIRYCLKEADISFDDLDIVVFYEKPGPGVEEFFEKEGFDLEREGIKKVFYERQFSMAASAYFPSPFEEAAILVVKGSEDGASACMGRGRQGDISILKESHYPESLGVLYSAFTYYCGFKIGSGEYKLMGLAPYGEPRYVDTILGDLVDLGEDGSISLNEGYFTHSQDASIITDKFRGLFGGNERSPESELSQRHMDIARSVQEVAERAMLGLAKEAYRICPSENLCLSGSFALNCKANGRILREGPFENIWIQPAATDAGGALGAAYAAWHEYCGVARKYRLNGDKQKASLLGPGYEDQAIEEFLLSKNIKFEKLDKDELLDKVARLLAEENVIGWFQGRMEFGPRALGSRSILADPRNKDMHSLINSKIKFRENFRPFAPSVLLEDAGEYFDINIESPYMLMAFNLREEKRVSSGEKELKGLKKLNTKRSDIPAVTHVDYSARVQTVKKEDDPIYYALLKHFKDITGCPVLINTSFNVRGEPIVRSPEDAYECFLNTDMDCLVMGSFIVEKEK